MKDKDKKLLESFKAGEYAQMTILVKLKDMDAFIEHMKGANLDMVILPQVRAKINFQSNDDSGGKPH